MSKKNLIIFLVMAPAFAVIMSLIHVWYGIYSWTYDGPVTKFQIKSGETFGQINYRLKKNNLVYSPRLFHRYAKFMDKLTEFKVGVYELKPGTNMPAMLELLTSGRAITTSVTIPEGKNLFEIAQILEANKITNAKEFIKLAKDSSVAKEFGIPGERLEGYLYPETYNLNKDMPAKEVIRAMISVFNNKVANIDFSQYKLSKHEVIILASVVEKETGAKFERPTIAGVFHNRLKKRMRLQSDPTTIYGIYENYNGNLRKKHLLEKTPYNTYKISGLPAGPISNPGLESIKAVLNPQKHDYLYFVSKNDGTHIFSKTYRDHTNAVNTWQKNRNNRAGKSWRDLKQ
jgi:UPF0755 protein